jgi:outer membrane protein
VARPIGNITILAAKRSRVRDRLREIERERDERVFMKRAVWALLVILGVALHPVIGAAQNIAVVDTQRVVNDSIIGRAARNNFEGEIKKGQAKLAQLKSDFEKQKGDLDKQAAILSGAALEAKREALSKKQIELQRAYQDIQEQLARDNEREMSQVVRQVSNVVQGLAKERGYDFVFERDRQAVVFYSEKVDITAEVVQLLDKQKVAL